MKELKTQSILEGTQSKCQISSETGRYRITSQFDGGERRVYAACLLRDEYDGWNEYHCTYRGGALSMYLLRKGSRWLSKDRRYMVESVEMISRAEYCRELERICIFKKSKAS